MTPKKKILANDVPKAPELQKGKEEVYKDAEAVEANKKAKGAP